MEKLLVLILACTVLACSTDDLESFDFLDCNELNENYKDYNGEEIECQFFYNLTEYNGQEYIELNSHCADLTRPFVINEDCFDICENEPYNENSDCGKYFESREIIEIILIEK